MEMVVVLLMKMILIQVKRVMIVTTLIQISDYEFLFREQMLLNSNNLPI